MTPPRITGTFLDEITHDIPSQNWGQEEWAREFALYRAIGIDTVILIRAGYRDRCVFPSRTVPNLRPVYNDLAEMFLGLSEENGIQLFFGLYDSGLGWESGNWVHDIELNLAFIDEVAERYGRWPSFAGWYLPHETSRYNETVVQLINTLSPVCKRALDLPVLVSPFPHGVKQFGAGAHPLDMARREWERLFAETEGSIDICAFQDGQLDYSELPAFFELIAQIAAQRGFRLWSNLESFDRDMPIKFPPADWRNLRYKLEAASRQVEKIVTFEFAHFLSPNSSDPSARHLFRRYCEFADLAPEIGIDQTGV